MKEKNQECQKYLIRSVRMKLKMRKFRLPDQIRIIYWFYIELGWKVNLKYYLDH